LFSVSGIIELLEPANQDDQYPPSDLVRPYLQAVPQNPVGHHFLSAQVDRRLLSAWWAHVSTGSLKTLWAITSLKASWPDVRPWVALLKRVGENLSTVSYAEDARRWRLQSLGVEMTVSVGLYDLIANTDRDIRPTDTTRKY
jgi:hypothetical protein